MTFRPRPRSEVDRGVLGNKSPESWKSNLNALLASDNVAVYGRVETALPTAGKIHIWITVFDITPRTTF